MVHHTKDDAQQMFDLFSVPKYISDLLHFNFSLGTIIAKQIEVHVSLFYLYNREKVLGS